MTNVRTIHVDWYSQRPPRFSGGPQLAYQGDHLSNMVVFDNAPELPNYYLLVEMKTDDAGPVVALPGIQLEGPHWVIPNYYTQICQQIAYQVCCKTNTGDYEHHSAKFKGTILPVITHNGEPIDQSPMFDPYIDILDKRVDELIVAAGDIQIDSEFKSDSTNPVQNKVVKAAIDGFEEDVAGLNGRLDQQADALDLTFQKNICTGATAGIYYVAWNDGDTIVETANANYMSAVIDLSGVEYITLNADWVGPSFSFFADADDKRISKVIDSKTADSGRVYSVPSGAVKAYLSQNIAGANGPIFTAKGVVAFSGNEDITTSEYNISNYPYDTDVSHVGVLDGLEIPYSNIKDERVNLADGIYTAVGTGTTVSGNTATVTTNFSGLQTSDLNINNDFVKISATPVFNTPTCNLKFRYYADNTWKTSDALLGMVSGQKNEIVIDKRQYVGTKYKILFQAPSLADGVTNTITINDLKIYDCTEFSASPYYNPVFEDMMGDVLGSLADVPKVFTVKKDGTGDFDSLVDAVTEACKYMDSVVYVGPGEWNVIEEFGENYMGAVSSNNATWGLVLKNRIHLIGTAKTVVKAINDSESTNFENIKTYFSVFNAGEKGFTLENINIEDENVRYSVHDDRGGSGPEPYTNKYIRCSMIHKNGKYSDCIGAGLGENQTVEIRGCYFEGDLGRTRLVYWHGNNNSQVTDALGKLTVCDNYFAQDGTFMLTKYGQSDTDTVAYVSGNSFGTAPSVNSGSVAPYDNMRIVVWNNEVRTV